MKVLKTKKPKSKNKLLQIVTTIYGQYKIYEKCAISPEQARKKFERDHPEIARQSTVVSINRCYD